MSKLIKNSIKYELISPEVLQVSVDISNTNLRDLVISKLGTPWKETRGASAIFLSYRLEDLK